MNIFEIEGKKVLITKNQLELNIDSMINDIEEEIKIGKNLVSPVDLTSEKGKNYENVKLQSNPIVFSDNQWVGSKNENWKILRQSFINACYEYAANMDHLMFSYVPSINAWFHKQIINKQNFNPTWHVHEYAVLTGVFNLKLNNSPPTTFLDRNTSAVGCVDYDISFEDNQWSIFPGNIIHSNNYCNDEPRYVVAANMYLGTKDIVKEILDTKDIL